MLYKQNKIDDAKMVNKNWIAFFFRFVFLTVFALVWGYIRLSWNGESPPEFTYKQNPAALNEDRLTSNIIYDKKDLRLILLQSGDAIKLDKTILL